jgi:hypothetical protein
MEFYKTCKVLPIFNFREAVNRNDLRYLSKEFDELDDEEFKLGVEDTIAARGIFKEIMYEYSALTANRSIIQSYMSQLKIEEAEFKYMIVEKILKNYEEFGEVEVLEILNGVGFKFDILGDIEKQIVGVLTGLKRLKTKIALFKINHDKKFNKKNRDIKEDFTDNLDEEAISLELALKISYSIDTKKTSVSKWINMWKVAEKINKPRNTN